MNYTVFLLLIALAVLVALWRMVNMLFLLFNRETPTSGDSVAITPEMPYDGRPIRIYGNPMDYGLWDHVMRIEAHAGNSKKLIESLTQTSK